MTIDPNEEISQNDPVRVVDSIVENPDLKDFRELYKGKGRCPYHPKMMHKIILYSYMNNVYSCRKIERQVQRDIHYIWLAAQERPDSVTINRFRNRVKNEINNIFTQVVPVLAEKGRSDPQQFQQKRQHQCRLLHCGKRGILIPPTVYALIFSRLSKFKVSYLVNVYAHVVTKQSDLCCKFSKKI